MLTGANGSGGAVKLLKNLVTQPLPTRGSKLEAAAKGSLRTLAGSMKSVWTFWSIKTSSQLINKFMKSERPQSLGVK